MWTRYLEPLLKIGLSAAIIAGIGWGIVTFNIEGEVDETRALIWDMSDFERSDTQQFARALEELGHEPPRVYNYNGNEVYFSTKKTRREPDEALRHYQRVFARRGVNEEAYSWMRPTKENIQKGADDPRVQKRYAAMLTGQMVPQWSSDTYASMGGGLIEGKPETPAELGEQIQHVESSNMDRKLERLLRVVEACDYRGGVNVDQLVETEDIERALSTQSRQCSEDVRGKARSMRKKQQQYKKLVGIVRQHKKLFDNCPEFHEFAEQYQRRRRMKFRKDVFETFRSIEMFRQNPESPTTVTAVWGDAGFNANRALADGAPDDPTVPACPSCVHGFRYSSRPNGQPYVTNVYRSSRHPDRLERYYLRTLTDRGWRRTRSNVTLQKALRHVEDRRIEGRHHLGFKRGDKHLMVTFQETAGGSTTITTMESRRPPTGGDSSLLP